MTSFFPFKNLLSSTPLIFFIKLNSMARSYEFVWNIHDEVFISERDFKNYVAKKWRLFWNNIFRIFFKQKKVVYFNIESGRNIQRNLLQAFARLRLLKVLKLDSTWNKLSKKMQNRNLKVMKVANSLERLENLESFSDIFHLRSNPPYPNPTESHSGM